MTIRLRGLFRWNGGETVGQGRGQRGGAWRCVAPLSNEDPACWRPAWGGVRLCGNDLWVHMIFGGWCRFAQDDTVGRRGRVAKNIMPYQLEK